MKTIKKIKISLGAFVILLLLSGITAFPLRSEMTFLLQHLSLFPAYMQDWIRQVKTAIDATPDEVLYGTDWLAFAHIIISLFFLPVFGNPIKYKANVLIGITACAAIFPLAFICGPIRNIPFFHQLIDCSFGVGGILLLWYVYKNISILEKQQYA